MSGAESPSFEAWARANGAQLRRAALLLTGDVHDADDLVQDVVVRRVCEVAADPRHGEPRRVCAARLGEPSSVHWSSDFGACGRVSDVLAARASDGDEAHATPR